MIDIDKLCVSIGPVAILDGVSMHAAAGSVVGVVGHNGAGKTTLMRAVAGILPALSGRVAICGSDVTRSTTRQRVQLGMGYMPEDRRLVPDLSVRDNIMLPMEVSGAADAQARLDRVLESIPELKPLILRKGNQLSGGQQKLAALARAICYGTRLLLLDEPFEGVAPALVGRLTQVLMDLRVKGPTILITDSEGAHLAGLCDARYVMERGTLRPAALEGPHGH
ncbi:MAG: ATP-binding cassette domain-containing protein [Pseudomonadota bacterium]